MPSTIWSYQISPALQLPYSRGVGSAAAAGTLRVGRVGRPQDRWRLGVDEKAAAKGHRYLTLVCDLEEGTVVVA